MKNFGKTTANILFKIGDSFNLVSSISIKNKPYITKSDAEELKSDWEEISKDINKIINGQ